jgi:hypothetical protein
MLPAAASTDRPAQRARGRSRRMILYPCFLETHFNVSMIHVMDATPVGKRGKPLRRGHTPEPAFRRKGGPAPARQ